MAGIGYSLNLHWQAHAVPQSADSYLASDGRGSMPITANSVAGGRDRLKDAGPLIGVAISSRLPTLAIAYSLLSLAGLVLLGLAGIFEGWRWQMFPAYAGFAILMLLSLGMRQARFAWRLLAALPLTALLLISAALAYLMPIVSLPAPGGPYEVGTFELSITDHSRRERYAPERNRELYVEVWYPADARTSGNIPVRTLFQELYEGDYNRTSFLFGYLKQVDTHSHVEAPVARSGRRAFPVLLFNHAADFGFTSQNQLLMEHLASHGYVILSIAHPYQSAKVNLAHAGTITRTDELPVDLTLPRPKLYSGAVGTVYDATNDIGKVSALKALLYPLSEEYAALPDDERAEFLLRSLDSAALGEFRHLITEELLEDFFLYEYIKDGSLIQYWVEDNKFIADSLESLRFPVPGLSDALDPDRLGVFGMSYGGAAAAEFCKTDERCDAGVNLDGTQWGRHWDSRLPVPFLMLYHDGHQGGNDFSYLPPVADFWDYRINGSAHTDFTDFAYLWPLLKKLGLSGSIDGMRMMEILNTVNLNFFDHYLKGSAIPGELIADIPEIVARKHERRSGSTPGHSPGR